MWLQISAQDRLTNLTSHQPRNRAAVSDVEYALNLFGRDRCEVSCMLS